MCLICIVNHALSRLIYCLYVYRNHQMKFKMTNVMFLETINGYTLQKKIQLISNELIAIISFDYTSTTRLIEIIRVIVIAN